MLSYLNHLSCRVVFLTSFMQRYPLDSSYLVGSVLSIVL